MTHNSTSVKTTPSPTTPDSTSMVFEAESVMTTTETSETTLEPINFDEETTTEVNFSLLNSGLKFFRTFRQKQLLPLARQPWNLKT